MRNLLINEFYSRYLEMIMKRTLSLGLLAIVFVMLPTAHALGQWGGMILDRLQDAAEDYDDEYDEPQAPPEQSQTGVAQVKQEPTHGSNAKLQQLAAASPDRYAIIIAMRDYPNSQQLSPLPGTDRDALRLAQVLQNGKFAEGNVVVVYDDAPKAELRPTQANILRELDSLLQRATDTSLVTVMITGHGVSMGGESYICPGDASDASVGDAETAAKELISVKELAMRLSKDCKAANKLLVVDACRDTSTNRTTGYVKNVESLEKPAEGVWLLSSCSEGQYSWMSDRIRKGEQHALFSHFVAEGLEGDADLLGDNDGDVSLFELYTYAFLKTRAAAKEINEKQTPELFGRASPFPLTVTGSFASRRKLTTSDPQMEASRSAAQLADDVVLNLRIADREYRETVSAPNTTEEAAQQSSRILHRYLCHLLGNRIRAALDLSEDCRLAWLAKGMCYRTCGLYAEAIDAFGRGGEPFTLVVKAQPGIANRYIGHAENGAEWRDEENQPIPHIEKAAGDAIGYAYLYDKPGDTKAKYRVKRQDSVRIARIQGDWFYVTAIGDWELLDGGWIHSNEVHWFPEAIDLYTPASPMRPWDGSAANRLDYASDGLSELAERLSLPAQAIEQAALPFDEAATRIYEAGSRIGEPISAINGVLGRFGIGIPNYPARVGAVAAGYAALPGGMIRHAAGYARIPSGYVSMAGGYVRAPANYARMAQQWSGHAHDYYAGHERSESVEKSRKQLKNDGKLEPVKERPILLVEIHGPPKKK